MDIKYDREARAAYIKLKKGKVSKTIKLMDRLLVDLDKNSDVLGIELLGFDVPLPGRKKRVRKEAAIAVK